MNEKIVDEMCKDFQFVTDDMVEELTDGKGEDDNE